MLAPPPSGYAGVAAPGVGYIDEMTFVSVF